MRLILVLCKAKPVPPSHRQTTCVTQAPEEDGVHYQFTAIALQRTWAQAGLDTVMGLYSRSRTEQTSQPSSILQSKASAKRLPGAGTNAFIPRCSDHTFGWVAAPLRSRWGPLVQFSPPLIPFGSPASVSRCLSTAPGRVPAVASLICQGWAGEGGKRRLERLKRRLVCRLYRVLVCLWWCVPCC